MGDVFDKMAGIQPNQSAALPQPVVSPMLDQQQANVGGTPVSLHGVTPAELQAATRPAGGDVFDKMTQQATPATPATSTTPPPQEGLLDSMKRKAFETVGKIVPDAAVSALSFGKEHLSEPLEISSNYIVKKGGEVGETLAAHPLESAASVVAGPAEFGNLLARHAVHPIDGKEKEEFETAHPTRAGIGEGIGQFGASLLTPDNLALMIAMPEVKAGSVFAKLVSSGFALQMSAGVKDQVQNLSENWGKMSEKEKASALTQLPLQVTAAMLATLHAGKELRGAPKPPVPGERTTVRPTTEKTAGVDAPIAAIQQENPSLTTRVAAKLTTPGKAAEFQNEQTKPAAQRQVISTLSQVATDKIAAHEALVNGEAAPAPITGTQTAGEHITPDEMWPEMQDTAGKTWNKARDASAHDTDVWNQRKTAAEKSHQEAVDHYNELIDNHNSDPANADNRMEPMVYDPAEAEIPEKPKTYDDLKAELDAAKDRTGRNNPTDVREKAKTVEVPKAEKAMDAWFKEHEDLVSPVEYQSAKSLWADSERFKEIANNLRGKLAKGTLSGNDIRGLEAVIDSKAIIRRGQAGIGEFRRLMGPEAVDNLKNVARLFDPLEKTDPRSGMIQSWGKYVAKHVVASLLVPALGLPYAAIEGGNIALELLMNHVMFDPEFGSVFARIADATKAAISTGAKLPLDLVTHFRNMVLGIAEKYKASRFSGEEGAVGYGVKKARAGQTPRPKNWPQDDDLIKKYGEASDPAQTAFLLTDGRKVKMPFGSEHDRMLGGKPTDDFRTPYINETGNIRMRAYGAYGDRQFGLSLPKGGITEAQLKEILKWGPQLRTGRVFLEQADPNGKNVVLHNATNEQLEQGVRSVVPVREAPISSERHQVDTHQFAGGSTYDTAGNDLNGQDKYSVGSYPERTQTHSKLDEGTLRAFKEQNADLLSQPDHAVGTWKDGDNHVLDVTKLYGDRDAAIKAGQAANQKAIYHLGSGELIDTGGTGDGVLPEAKTFAGVDLSKDRLAEDQALQELADGKITRNQLVSRAQELKDAAKATSQNLAASEITTRRPKAVGADLSNKPGQHSNWDAIEQADRNNPSGETALGKKRMGYKEKMARTVAGYTGIEYTPEELANPDKVLSKFVTRLSQNLEWLYEQIPEELRGRTRQWYDAANKIVSAKATQYGFTPEQGAGVTAALSPQNPWDNNIGLANRMMDVYRNRQKFPFSPEMEKMSAELRKVPTQSKAFRGMLRDIAGKKLGEVKNPNPDVQAVQRALWIRLYDEAHGSPINDQYAPTGEVVGHSPDTKSWIGLDHVSKAVKILENGSVENINGVMGQGHKIRNFYNNLINPNSKAGHVTIDTHATAAAQLQPFGAKDNETVHTFGNTNKGIPGAPKDASTGLQGTYPLYAEAYQRVARKLGIQPRELQSVTWEAAKSLFDNKTPELKARVKEIWQDVQDGKLTPEEARETIKSEANGFSKPAWMSDEEWEKLGAEGEDTSFMGESGVVPGDELLMHIQKLHPEWKINPEQSARDILGMGILDNYQLEEVPLNKLTAGDDYSPALAKKFAERTTPIPAIILDDEGGIRDGNHRVAAAKLRGDTTIQAYVPVGVK